MSWRTIRAAGQTGEPTRHVAVIDLGSNSWRLVVFSYGSAPSLRWWKRTDELYEAVRIGEGLAQTGELSEAAMARGIETLVVFERFCHASGLADADVHAVATSAIRDARNGEQFLAQARTAIGYEIEILSARAEAHYGAVAALNSSTLTDGVVLDIGGGSLQLVLIEGREEIQSVSFPLGAVRTTEAFLSGPGPARKKDLARLRAHVKSSLSGIEWLKGRRGRLVAMGGAVRNLAAAAQRAAFGSSGGIDIGVQGFLITADALSELVANLAALPAAERRAVPGIKPGRGDIILGSAVVLQTCSRSAGSTGSRRPRPVCETACSSPARSSPRARAAVRRRPRGRRAQPRDPVRVGSRPHRARRAARAPDARVADRGRAVRATARRAQLLWAAAMLHDVGMTISYDDHHKHSRYLIVSAELPGFDPRERALIAQITRYHRKGAPKLGEWTRLGREGTRRCSIAAR